jgi:glycerol uptake facilitator-like aquaporin
MSVLVGKLAAEFVGTALLLATVVGSGIMGERLSGGNAAIALLANALATGAVLYALISAMGSLSGAHFNPVVTLAEAWLGKLPWHQVAPYVVTQVVAALAGVVAAHWMFELPAFFASQHVRSGPSQMFSEAVATFGLITVILNCARWKPDAIPAAVAAYITAAYWFTASTSFANPAVTLARSLTDTFSGIRPADAPGFIVAQFTGAAMATALYRWMAAKQSL